MRALGVLGIVAGLAPTLLVRIPRVVFCELTNVACNESHSDDPSRDDSVGHNHGGSHDADLCSMANDLR